MKRWWLGLALAISGASQAQDWTCRDFPTIARAAHSAHFCAYWDDTAKVSVGSIDSSLAALEAWWDFLVVGKRFPEPQPDRVPRMRLSLFVQDQGWTQGGMEGGSPALWLAPGALKDPWAQGHALAQSLQAATGGFQGSPYAGGFRDGFANWLTHQRMDSATGCVELYRRQVQIHYGSTRNRFCNWPFLEFLKDRHGYPLLDSLWTRWPGKVPAAQQDVLGMIQEELGLDSDGLADLWGRFSLRMAVTDFASRDVFRKAWDLLRDEEWGRLDHVELEGIDPALGRYRIAPAVAPQAYAFNVVPLHDHLDTVRIRFRGQVQSERPQWTPLLGRDPDTLPLPGSAWRWGVSVVDTAIVTAPQFRYLGPFDAPSGEVALTLGPSEQAFLVVAATPSPRPRIAWDQSHRSLYRYPWMVEIRGARPEGWQAARHNPLALPGARHGNGGGFVAASAHVDSNAWVGPQAQVLEQAQVLGAARVEDRAIVKGAATVRDRARIREWARVWGKAIVRDRAEVAGHAIVTGGLLSDSSRVDEYATIQWEGTQMSGAAHLGGTAVDMAPARLSGKVQVVGDAELWSVQLANGVFTGLVDEAASHDPLRGADLVELPPEATRSFPVAWDEAGASLARFRTDRELRITRRGRGLEIAGLPAGTRSVRLTDLQGRRLGTETANGGLVRFGQVPRGLVLVTIEGADGILTGRTVEP